MLDSGPSLIDLTLERLGEIVEQSSSETYVFSTDECKFILVNKGARDNLGYHMEELRRLTPWDIKPDYSREEFLDFVEPLKSGEKNLLRFETIHERKDGTTYPVAVQLQLIESADGSLFYAAIQDISERKEVERQLRHVSDRLDAILNNTKMSVFLMDERQHCIFMNSAAERLTGFTLSETEGRPLHDVVHHTYPDGRPFPISESAIDRAFPEDNQVSGEEIFVHKDGSFYPVGYTASSLRDSAGKPVGTIIEVREITQELEARKALEEFNDTLKDRVEKALEERRQIEAQLLQSQKMEAIGQLTGGIAHDFNNLLQVIGGSLQLIQKDVAHIPKAKERVNNALEAVTKGAKLASQLLAFGRQQTLQPKPTNIGRLVRGMNEMLSRALGETIEVETVIAGGLWNCLADPAQVENAILNLAINARDAMPEGGKLTIEAGNASLDDRYASEEDVEAGQYIMLAITDTGQGISQENLDKVFEPFFTTKKVGEGSGLGLSMVFGFVKQSGGHMKVYSEEGEGTTFRIYLPRTREEEIAEPLPTSGFAKGGTEVVLVAEDDEAVRETAVEMLKDLGYSVLEANNGENAMAVINNGTPIDLLFTDVVMPGKLRSPELARLAKRKIPNLAVLFTSGYTQNAIVHGGRLDPGVDLLSKPYSQAELAEKLRAVLAKREVGEQAGKERDRTNESEHTKPEVSSPRVLVLEDEVLIRMMLVDIIEECDAQASQAGSLKEARQLLEDETFDVMFADLSLPDGSAIELIEQLVRAQSDLQIVVCSGGNIEALLEQHGLAEQVGVLPKPYNNDSVKKWLSR